MSTFSKKGYEYRECRGCLNYRPLSFRFSDNKPFAFCAACAMRIWMSSGGFVNTHHWVERNHKQLAALGWRGRNTHARPA